jgi:hypothetical protein
MILSLLTIQNGNRRTIIELKLTFFKNKYVDDGVTYIYILNEVTNLLNRNEAKHLNRHRLKIKIIIISTLFIDVIMNLYIYIYICIIKQQQQQQVYKVWNCHRNVQKETEQNILSKHTIGKKN